MKRALIVTGLAMMATVMFSTYTFAKDGWGRGYHHRGDGYRMGGSENCPGYGNAGKGRYGQGSLSEEDAAKVESAREAFFKDTRALRQSIRQKRLEMKAEMAKPEPDTAKLTDLQKGISGLEADFDLKRMNHRLEMKKLLPDYHAGDRGGRWGHGRGADRGDCWRQ